MTEHVPMNEMSDEDISEVIEELCESKVAEFKLLGYEHVTPMEIWDCVNERYSKEGMPRLHRIVNDVLSLKITDFMNWMTMSAFKGEGLFGDPPKNVLD